MVEIFPAPCTDHLCLCSKNTPEGFVEFWRLHWDSLGVHKLAAMPLQPGSPGEIVMMKR